MQEVKIVTDVGITIWTEKLLTFNAGIIPADVSLFEVNLQSFDDNVGPFVLELNLDASDVHETCSDAICDATGGIVQ